MNRNRGLLVVALIMALAVTAQAHSAFRLTVQKRGKEAAKGVGVMVAEELLLTSHRLLRRGDRYLVGDPATGARLAAIMKAGEADSDLALLSVPGLQGEPVKVALRAPGDGRRVHLLAPEGIRRNGTMYSVFKGKDRQVRYRFTSIMGKGEAAAPLMNNCGELVAVSQGRPGSGKGPGANFGVSGALPVLKAFLFAQGVRFQGSNKACPSLKDQLRQAEKAGKELEEQKTLLEKQRQQAEEEKSALEEEIKQLEVAEREGQQRSQEQVQALEALEAKRVALEERLRRQGRELSRRQRELEQQTLSRKELQDQVERYQEEGRRKDEELARSQREREEGDRLRWLIVTGLGLLLLVAGALVRRQFRARQHRLNESARELAAARSSLERSNATFSDVILVGAGPAGQEVRIKVNGNAVARAESGQVIGRSSANADYVISVDSISRRHACLRLDGDTLTIEDMNSLNGTGLDGVRLKPGEARVVRDGARLTFGEVDLVVHFLGDDGQ